MAHCVSLHQATGCASSVRDIVGVPSLNFCPARHAVSLSPARRSRKQSFVFLKSERVSAGPSSCRSRTSIRCSSHEEGEAQLNVEESDEFERSFQPYGIPEMTMPDRWDVVGLGQAMVDFSGIVEDGFLQGLGLVKGTRKVVNHEERGNCIRALDGRNYKVTAGGSLSNTLVALARLGAGYNDEPSLNVAMTGSVGSDALGDFYRTKLKRANVHFLSEPIPNGTTGTVIVLTTPDAQRTMLSYQGMSSLINYDEALEEQIASSKILVVEGYLWELSETVESIAKACQSAREKGILVALTASDISCVKRHREKMWKVMSESADMIFCNSDEARALLNGDGNMSPAMAAEILSKFCHLVSVTDGARGSYIGLKGEVSYVQPAPCVPVDTCGAGDAYAAGVLYGILRGIPHLKGIGNLAARVASVVVGQQGTRLREEDAKELSSSVPTFACMPVGLINLTAHEEQSVNA
ncbi:hypothetical protein MPTK1_1g12030 [Marchantia polymorpha subsp. ruderalis]|uniref:Carbohydrate kinase PfkB domain-containing protein n=2 Tax=Marchantia polymorpha TaxID=3197 RepID=A0AAF6AP80_MARPO|nr:hypothetical protein MARPO_0014s0025 [Marchantia polymorpha]BBM98250.1 hypothetical protein Mp_1g12030 [Marchantia polymorpha subsp. ruderalis]|eukprot:PTQ45470.1 hypothetical protein MARPO_0014s0025 [Marchantia polymorpha]